MAKADYRFVREPGGSFLFEVTGLTIWSKRAILIAATPVVLLLWLAPVGLIFLLPVYALLAISILYDQRKNRTNPPFTVSPEGIRIGGKIIAGDRIHSIDLGNSHRSATAERSFDRGPYSRPMAEGMYEHASGRAHLVTVQHGGTRTRLAGGLDGDTAAGLREDVRRALAGTLIGGA